MMSREVDRSSAAMQRRKAAALLYEEISAVTFGADGCSSGSWPGSGSTSISAGVSFSVFGFFLAARGIFGNGQIVADAVPIDSSFTRETPPQKRNSNQSQAQHGKGSGFGTYGRTCVTDLTPGNRLVGATGPM